MSRIGKQPVAVPAGVEVTIDGNTVTVKGPKGELTRSFPSMMTIRREGDDIVVERPDDSREAKSFHGLTRTLVSNMVEGGFRRLLQEAAAGGRGLPRCSQGPRPGDAAGLLRTPCWCRLPRTSRSRFPAKPRSSCPAPARSRWAKWPPTSASGASRSPTRARASATRAKWCAASSARRQRATSPVSD